MENLLGFERDQLINMEVKNIIKDCNIEEINKLIKENGINYVYPYGSTLLSFSTYVACDNSIIDFLLNYPGVDINFKHPLFGSSILISSAINNRNYLITKLLERIDIDVESTDYNGLNFIYYLLKTNNANCIWNCSLQEKILENGRDDIILFFDKYNLANSYVKHKNPDLFKAKEWGLV